MTNNYYGNYNPYQQLQQQLQQRLQSVQPMTTPVPSQIPMQSTYQQPMLPPQEDKVIVVINEDIAKSTNIPLDGSTTYFKYDNRILARRWNIAESKVSSVTYEVIPEETQSPVKEVITSSNEDRLKSIEDTLQEILKKVTYPINKKTSKTEKGEDTDGK